MTLTLPIYWTEHFKTKPSKTHLVGENFFRNAHFHVKNKMKQDYASLVSRQVTTKPNTPLSRFSVEYVLYYKNPSSDMSNILSKVEKFILDALIDLGVIVNDNVLHHTSSTYTVGGCDKTDPRVEITIKELDATN